MFNILVLVILSKFVTFSLGGVYNTETFRVSAKSERIVCQITDDYYVVTNVGKYNVTVQILAGGLYYLSKDIYTTVFVPGERKLIRVKGRYARTGVKVINNEDVDALVNAFSLRARFKEWDSYSGDYFSLDDKDLTETVVTSMAEYIPIVGEALSGLIEYFWPDDGSLWQNVLNELSPIIDDKVQKWIGNLLEKEILQVQHKIEFCQYEIEEDPDYDKKGRHFMNIVEDLIGFEKKFTDEDVKYNYFLFPLYTVVINLKVSFYVYGLNNAEKIGLDNYEVKRLKHYLKKLIYDKKRGAIRHVMKVCDAQIENTYNHVYPEFVFDGLAGVRQNCAVNGYEHFNNWRHVLVDPYSKNITKVQQVFVYSTQFGRNSALQSREMIALASKTFTPPVSESGVLPIKKITVYLKGNHIGGLRVHYENGESATTGPKKEGNSVEVDFKGQRLNSLTVTGSGRIASLEFGFKDGRSQKVGSSEGAQRTFELPCHYIAGFFGTGADVALERDALANIAVSYVGCPCDEEFDAR